MSKLLIFRYIKNICALQRNQITFANANTSRSINQIYLYLFTHFQKARVFKLSFSFNIFTLGLSIFSLSSPRQFSRKNACLFWLFNHTRVYRSRIISLIFFRKKLFWLPASALYKIYFISFVKTTQ